MSLRCLLVVCLLVGLGCGESRSRPGLDGGADGSIGMDATTAPDTGADPDTGLPDTGPPDAGFDAGPPDAGFDAGPPDAGDVDAGPLEGCNPLTGVECDGDWTGRCGGTGCTATECCAPVGGSFGCVARDAAGACPAADIWVDETRATSSVEVVWENFADGDCAIVEGCVMASGWRRLLKFDTWTPNTGGADMPELFEYSSCHRHNHFNSYAAYELRAADGTVVATGHKQAFCLLDFYRYPGTDSRGTRYTCSFQGIQTGFQDVYGSHLDCQWVDVTGVPPGGYTLHIELNHEHILNESNYANNVSDIPVTIPPDAPGGDITAACPGGTSDGPSRSCGWMREGVHACTPGATVTTGCSDRCGVGSCTGDPMIRVCEASDDPDCTTMNIIGSNDDSACGGSGCGGGGGGGCCPRTSFACPSSGSYVVFWAPYAVGGAATCTVDTM
jgi:hypothetical protein